MQLLNGRMDVILDNLRQVVDEGFPAAQQAHKEDVAKWGESRVLSDSPEFATDINE